MEEKIKALIGSKAKERWADPEFKAKASARATAFWADKKNKERMQAAMTSAYTDERKVRLSTSLRQHKRSDAHATNISKALKGKPNWARGTTKTTNEAQANKSASVRRTVAAKAAEQGVKAFPGQRTAVIDDRIVRYCMCSPVCMFEVTRPGRKYFESHGASTPEIKLKLSRASLGKPKSKEHALHVSQGLQGHVHSEETRRKIGASKEGKPSWSAGLTKRTDPRIKKISNALAGKMPGSFTGFRVEYDGPRGHETFRSEWEMFYARWLDASGFVWEYEKKTFQFQHNGQLTSYTPDFYLPDFDEYVEVKGYYSDKNKAKMEAFHIAYPLVRVKMLFKKEIDAVIAELTAKTMPPPEDD